MPDNQTRTVVIWDELDSNLKFFVFVGRDISHLNRVYINSADASDDAVMEINSIAYDADGNNRADMSIDFPTDEVRNGAKVVVMGYLP